MGIEQKILVSGASLRAGVASVLCAVAALSACGQKGALYMPNDPEFKQRATLPDIVRRQLPGNTPAPAAGAASSAAPAAQSSTTSPATAASAATGR
ncbi:LPS translocon maturation chaperone LptM [Limnohabitans sp.]|uniref:LPS translocon maturation chaperone LptM n=1 Tax=Limnohabitans sp. TaxID=1907725 RepID=UPI00286F0C62|nr:lipoprotein [Limnohabitans sp.]